MYDYQMGHHSYITVHPSRARVLSLWLFVLGLWLCCVRQFSFLFIAWSTCRFLCAPVSFSFFACCRTLASFKAVQNAPIHLHLTQFLCFSMRWFEAVARMKNWRPVISARLYWKLSFIYSLSYVDYYVFDQRMSNCRSCLTELSLIS